MTTENTNQNENECRKAIAYLILNDVLTFGAYWPKSYIDWAANLMRGEKRTGIEIVRSALNLDE